MVTFFKATPRKTTKEKSVDFICTDYDLHGRGVGKINNITCFVEGVMIGEKARITPKKKNNIIEGDLIKIISQSPERKSAFCSIQDKCGGCPLYYLDEDVAIQAKLKGIKKLFAKTSGYELADPDFIYSNKEKNYRRSCRLSLRSDHKKIVLGFRENKSHSIVKVDTCAVLTTRLNSLLEPLSSLVNKLEAKKKVGHIELVDADNIAGLAIRLTDKINFQDQQILLNFAQEQNIYLSILEPYVHEIDKKEYLKETKIYSPCDLFVNIDNLQIKILPTSFLQVNKKVNEQMVNKALDYAKVDANFKVLDLFCGLGNFTFPFAKRVKGIVGVDVVSQMINLATENATNLGINNVKFAIANLDETLNGQNWTKEQYDLAILDPGRTGAYKAAEFVSKLKIKRIIMISCNPVVASRDCSILNKNGYKLEKYAIFDMFPYTTHIEMMLVFSL